MKASREAWVDLQPALDPERLIFIDESGVSTKMARLRGWASLSLSLSLSQFASRHHEYARTG